MPVLEQTDRDLAHRHRYGDAEAFAEIYQRFADMVFNLCLRMSGDREEAADLSQEAFLRIYRHLGKFRGRSSLKTWIYRVTLNLCRSRLARKRLDSLPILPALERTAADPGRGPEGAAEAADARRRVATALRGIKPVFREAVILRDLEGMTYDEIAEILQVRVGTVRSRIARGRERLRTALEASA